MVCFFWTDPIVNLEAGHSPLEGGSTQGQTPYPQPRVKGPSRHGGDQQSQHTPRDRCQSARGPERCKRAFNMPAAHGRGQGRQAGQLHIRPVSAQADHPVLAAASAREVVDQAIAAGPDQQGFSTKALADTKDRELLLLLI